MSPTPTRLPSVLGWLDATAVLAGVDHASKAHFADIPVLGEAIENRSWFNLLHLLNLGATSSLFAEWDAGQATSWMGIA